MIFDRIHGQVAKTSLRLDADNSRIDLVVAATTLVQLSSGRDGWSAQASNVGRIRCAFIRTWGCAFITSDSSVAILS